MSEHAVAVVRLDQPGPDEVRDAADRVRGLLVDRGLIVPNDRYNRLWQPSAWMPGPRAVSALEPVPWFDAFLTTANNGVDLETERSFHHPVENDEAPRCPRCATTAPPRYYADYNDWAEAWITDGTEPWFTCGTCAFEGPVGDWAGEFSLLVGAPAVTFHNWPPLLPDLLTDLRTALGGRTGVVRTHS